MRDVKGLVAPFNEIFSPLFANFVALFFAGAVGGDDAGDGDDKEKAEEEERERQEAIKEAEDRRKEKHRKMEEEREKMRQDIRDKVSRVESSGAAGG